MRWLTRVRVALWAQAERDRQMRKVLRRQKSMDLRIKEEGELNRRRSDMAVKLGEASLPLPQRTSFASFIPEHSQKASRRTRFMPPPPVMPPPPSESSDGEVALLERPRRQWSSSTEGSEAADCDYEEELSDPKPHRFGEHSFGRLARVASARLAASPRLVSMGSDKLAALLLGERSASPATLSAATDKFVHDDHIFDRVEDQLHIVSTFLLTQRGSAALALTNLTDSARGLLVERAAARISFQPRFVSATVLGIAEGEYSKLPAMDSNGRSDAYVMLKLQDEPGGVSYPTYGCDWTC
jgi:hypothetical protein